MRLAASDPANICADFAKWNERYGSFSARAMRGVRHAAPVFLPDRESRGGTDMVKPALAFADEPGTAFGRIEQARARAFLRRFDPPADHRFTASAGVDAPARATAQKRKTSQSTSSSAVPKRLEHADTGLCAVRRNIVPPQSWSLIGALAALGSSRNAPLSSASIIPAMNTLAGLHPELESLLAFWFVKCGARKFPSRAALDGKQRWAGNLALFDVLQYGALRVYECRSCAGALAARLGPAPTGLSTDELAPEIRAELRAGFEQAWLRAAPHIAQARGIDGANYSDLVLPLSENGKNIDGMLLGSYPLK
jgi:hypothetical protein